MTYTTTLDRIPGTDMMAFGIGRMVSTTEMIPSEMGPISPGSVGIVISLPTLETAQVAFPFNNGFPHPEMDHYQIPGIEVEVPVSHLNPIHLQRMEITRKMITEKALRDRES